MVGSISECPLRYAPTGAYGPPLHQVGYFHCRYPEATIRQPPNVIKSTSHQGGLSDRKTWPNRPKSCQLFCQHLAPISPSSRDFTTPYLIKSLFDTMLRKPTPTGWIPAGGSKLSGLPPVSSLICRLYKAHLDRLPTILPTIHLKSLPTSSTKRLPSPLNA